MSYIKRTTRRLLGTTVGAAMLLSLPGCGYAKNIHEFPEPWQTLEPGKPVEKPPRVNIVTPGEGAVVEPGDLVQIRIRVLSLDKTTWNDRGEWWLWIGFRSSKETSFFSYDPGMASAFVGMRQGSIFEFLEPREGIGSGPQYAGEVWINPIGNKENYSWRKNSNKFVYLYISDTSGLSKFEVERVCKGQTQYRTVRLFDDSPVQVRVDSNSYTSHEPREMWFDEARIEAKCQDGKTAIFQYGPTDSINGKEGRSPVIGYFDRWFRGAWEKLPTGVQLK